MLAMTFMPRQWVGHQKLFWRALCLTGLRITCSKPSWHITPLSGISLIYFSVDWLFVFHRWGAGSMTAGSQPACDQPYPACPEWPGTWDTHESVCPHHWPTRSQPEVASSKEPGQFSSELPQNKNGEDSKSPGMVARDLPPTVTRKGQHTSTHWPTWRKLWELWASPALHSGCDTQINSARKQCPSAEKTHGDSPTLPTSQPQKSCQSPADNSRALETSVSPEGSRELWGLPTVLSQQPKP